MSLCKQILPGSDSESPAATVINKRAATGNCIVRISQASVHVRDYADKILSAIEINDITRNKYSTQQRAVITCICLAGNAYR